jgi:hypothetical protein
MTSLADPSINYTVCFDIDKSCRTCTFFSGPEGKRCSKWDAMVAENMVCNSWSDGTGEPLFEDDEDETAEGNGG